MNWKKWLKQRATPTPEPPVRTVEDVLGEQLKELRQIYLCVRDPDGDWTAYHKDAQRGHWYVWRHLRYVPELRDERPIRPFTEATDHPNTVTWEVPDTFPNEWNGPDPDTGLVP